MTEDAFTLDPRLAADGPAVGDLPLCHVRLVEDRRFFWVSLTPRRAGMSEVFDLDTEDRLRLMEEIALVSRAVKDITACAKLNIAALGNMVPQLHLHIIARNPGDAAWPGVVFGTGTREPLSDLERQSRLEALRGRLDVHSPDLPVG
ncbi:diadenosine tetraphosphate (Ap4A) HIT family hydrolase [Xanthobacter sp. SG618]|uniref:HIT family protein n=1 Tax=Xanthobacter sp. SG618 TaxID=2587121 RepID=UPI00145D88BC|nr:HIT family protein [Xanthobacter sp. SG618]NMN57261.1 diadenosine tetraphosphate (Ap4A) HIT family hydrolase [Xanthobacter sp. SG618]